MPNSYFQFKQFTIHQDLCAMKVSTDACLLGAWAAVEKGNTNALDIGCGTGVLSLMLAQKSNEIKIHAIDLDKDAAQQANQNFLNSKFVNQLSVQHIALQDFNSDKQFDVIISNPPYFENSLLSANDKLNKAKHETTLTLPELLNKVNRLLSNTGNFYLVLPIFREEEIIELALVENLFPKSIMRIQHSQHKAFKYVLINFTKMNAQNILETSFCIKDNLGNDSVAMKTLLKEYYLYF